MLVLDLLRFRLESHSWCGPLSRVRWRLRVRGRGRRGGYWQFWSQIFWIHQVETPCSRKSAVPALWQQRKVPPYELLGPVLIGITIGSGLYHLDNLTLVSLMAPYPEGDGILAQVVQEAD